MERLKHLWNAQWHSTVEMLRQSEDASKIVWESQFALLHGQHLLFWSSEFDFDEGFSSTTSDGGIRCHRLILSGHAGLGTLSPLEMRKTNDVDRIVVVFGKGNGDDGQQKQERLVLRVPDEHMKAAVEKLIVEAVTSTSHSQENN